MKLSDWLPGVPVESNIMNHCPCCGSEKTTRWDDPVDGLAKGGCLSCGLEVVAPTVSEVLVKWNRRHVPWVDPKVRLPEKPRLGNPYVPVLVLLDGELSSDFAFYSTSEAFFSWERGGEAITDTIVGWMYLPLINNVQEYYERSKKDADDAE
nr:MAG: Restriction alleviation protein Lar [Bacteriophage sp.]